MKSKLGDQVRLKHILDSINEIQTALSGQAENAFVGNHVLRIAVVKWIEIIGEASNHLSEEIKNKADVEWDAIIGLRHIVVHEYFGINYETIWNIAIGNLPDLKEKIEQLLKDFE